MAATSTDDVSLTEEQPSINNLEDIEPAVPSANQALVVSVDDEAVSNAYDAPAELHITNSEEIRNIAKIIRSVSIKSDHGEAHSTQHRTRRPSSTHSRNSGQDIRKSAELSGSENYLQTDTRFSELNSSEPADTPTASLNSEISDVVQYYPEEGPSVAHEDDMEEENPMSDEWKSKPRHYFILTEAGKPVFTRHGSEDKLAPLMGVLLALVSFVHDRNDTIRHMIAGQHKFIFMPRPPLILVAVCSTRESVRQIQIHLNYIYNTIISILTLSQLKKIYETKKNFDLRRLLGDPSTDKFFQNLCESMDMDAQFLLQAVHCFRINGSTRDFIGQALQQSKTEDLAFALLIYKNKMVNICRMKEHTLHPADLHIIVNLVQSTSTAFQTGESWIPICLANFNPLGFLHARISYLDEDCSTCLVLLSADRDSFFALSDAKNKVLAKLKRHNCLQVLAESGRLKPYTVESIGVPPLRHFIYKSKNTSQFTWPEIGFPYITEEQKQRIFGIYQHAHGRIHDSDVPLKLLYLVCETEVVLGWVTSGFELYAIFSPLVSKNTAISAVNRLLRWIKKHEDELFILRPPVFPR